MVAPPGPVRIPIVRLPLVTGPTAQTPSVPGPAHHERHIPNATQIHSTATIPATTFASTAFILILRDPFAFGVAGLVEKY